ncbi:MAG: single-stranded-DNA-specific exonuclease RecJ [Candidatus Niyogibacteria bacterium]|nr:MAG: single-stranded-DNA-specific exonuclease RecJ [Candidatus Niyogibacteria bacterium]
MQKRWDKKVKYPKDWAEDLKEYGDLTLQLAYNRGLETKEDIEKFLNPDYGSLGNPLDIKGMDKATNRIIEAVSKKEKIIIYGDYDADGVCSSAILADFFRAAGLENAEIFIPDLFKYGHGLNDDAVKYIFEKRASLVITIDNGISENKEIKKLEEGGVNVVVLDHHIVPDDLPPAYVIVDLCQKGEKYPFHDFCASGLAFKTVSAILQKNRFGLVEGWEKWLLDLAALGTIADMVPLLGENRVLVYWGLEVLKKTRRVGLKILAEKAGVDLSGINSEDVSFYLAPRINVAGRLDHATLAGDLILTNSYEEAEWLVRRLEELTVERKAATERIAKEVEEMFLRGDCAEIIVAGNNDWQTGVLGAAASRISKNLSSTVILWGKGDAVSIKGSARSAGDVNVRDLLIEAGIEMYLDFGGHPMAAGFTLKKEYARDFNNKIKKAFASMPKDKNAYADLILESELAMSDVSAETSAIISKFEPFGQENPRPNFLFKNLDIFSARTFGNGGTHLEISFKNSKNEIINAIGFFSARSLPEIKAGDKIDLAGSLDLSKYKGREELRLKIEDFKII